MEWDGVGVNLGLVGYVFGWVEVGEGIGDVWYL